MTTTTTTVIRGEEMEMELYRDGQGRLSLQKKMEIMS
jgi:hypothetical protein